MLRFLASQLSDRELADKIVQEGDEGAFRQLYRRHSEALIRLLQGMLDDRRDAEDAEQESWIVVTDQLAAFRWEASFRTWLLGIGFNVARTTRRGGARHRAAPLDAGAHLTTLPVEPPIDLERALTALAAGHRTVFLLHDVEGFTHREIARRLGISTGTSKSQLSDARHALRALLEPQEVLDVS